MRLIALLMITAIALMAAHVVEVLVWAGYYNSLGMEAGNIDPFDFAFENYTALGYGDAVPTKGFRVVGPITVLNGLLLIGWSVAVIFEVMKMADVQIGRDLPRSR
jgi:Ion channel